MTAALADAGSFRDPSGTIYNLNGEIYRAVTETAASEFASFRQSGLLERLIDDGNVVSTREVDAEVFKGVGIRPAMALHHQRIPFISYPYEWSFPLLKSAALLHLNIHLDALASGFNLSDATAYNVQFVGPTPVFIDVLSFRQYRDGEVWSGHRQFCEQFLNPLLLNAYFGVTHNSWFRGNLEGIEVGMFARMLPWWRNFSFGALSHVTMQAKLQAMATNDVKKFVSNAKAVKLPKRSYERMLLSLRDWISNLKPKATGATVWQGYAENTTYDSAEQQSKKRFVAEFCEKVRPRQLWDLGCNTGEYSEVALQSGAENVIGFDVDHGALERAHTRAVTKNLKFLPLYQDAANPSPDQGWANSERRSVRNRGPADAVIALAFEHHLAIGRNIPLDDVVETIIRSAPTGIVEYVNKQDPTVQQLLALREDIFPGYTPEVFEAALVARAKILKKETVSASGRTLYWFDRTHG